jgi:transcriptional regulator of acetoin/glycerol metabolism
MTEEILKLEHHQRLMSIKALQKTRNVKDAASILGVTDRTLYRWMKKFNLNKKNYLYVGI